MKKLYENFASMAIIVLFGLFALSSTMEPGERPDCEVEKNKWISFGYRPCTPLDPPVNKDNSFTLTVKDKQTGLPIEGISIKVVMHFYSMVFTTCGEDENKICYVIHLWTNIFGESYVATPTDVNGQYSNQTYIYKYEDKSQMNNITFHITDKTGKYAPKVEYISFPYDVSHVEITTHLLNNDLL